MACLDSLRRPPNTGLLSSLPPSMPPSASSSSSSLGSNRQCLRIFPTRSSRKKTISFVKYLILHGLLAKMACFTFDLKVEVKYSGIGPRGRTPATPGSFGPGTNTNRPSFATLGNFEMMFAKSSKYLIVAFVPSDDDNGLLVKFPMNTKMGNGEKSLYPSSICSSFSTTAGLSRCTSDKTTNAPSAPCSTSCDWSFSSSESEPTESKMSVFWRPMALMASERFSTMGLPML
mmetsp:Transcript_23357/g.56372  ORF Transcript_23357/g.56372 Transcript_23357/m.56372 type:complete len:231 (-) Transcript_23357:190-882(-)